MWVLVVISYIIRHKEWGRFRQLGAALIGGLMIRVLVLGVLTFIDLHWD